MKTKPTRQFGLLASLCLFTVLASTDAQVLPVSIPANKLSLPEGYIGLVVPSAGIVPGSGGTVNVGPGTYSVVTSSGITYGTFTVSDQGGGLLAITATTGSLQAATGGIDFDLSSLLQLKINSAALAEFGDSSVGLQISGVSSGIIRRTDVTCYLPAGDYSVTTLWGHSYGTFTIAGEAGSLGLSETTGSLVSVPDGRIDFDRDKLFKATLSAATLSAWPEYSGVAFAISGVSANAPIAGQDVNYYLPAGEYRLATLWNHLYGTFRIAGDFGSLALADTTGSVIVQPPNRIDFDRLKLLPVSMSSASLSCPFQFVTLGISGVSAKNIDGRIATYYLPPGEYTVVTLASHLYGTFTLSGDFGAVEMTETTGAILPTSGGIDFDPAALQTVLVTPVPPLYTWSIFGVGTADGPARLRLPEGDYKLRLFSELGGFSLSASGVSVMPSTLENFAISLVSSFCNQNPITYCKNVTIFAGRGCSASADINEGSLDPDPGDSITLHQSPVGPYPVGNTVVTLTVTDSQGASSQCSATVRVIDDEPPHFACPADVTVFFGALPPPVTISTDNCDPNPSVASSDALSGSCPMVITRTYTVADASGNSSTCQQTITVNNLFANGGIIWHQPLARNGGSEDTDPGAGGTLKYRFKLGSTIPIEIHALNCGGSDVTSNSNVIGKVQVFGDTNCDGVADGNALAIDYSGVGEAGGVMDKIGGYLKYNLDTKKLPKTSKCFILQVTVTDTSTGEALSETVPLQVK
jgi:hypothetical protein